MLQEPATSKEYTVTDKIQNYEKMFLCGSSMDWVTAII